MATAAIEEVGIKRKEKTAGLPATGRQRQSKIQHGVCGVLVHWKLCGVPVHLKLCGVPVHLKLCGVPVHLKLCGVPVLWKLFGVCNICCI